MLTYMQTAVLLDPDLQVLRLLYSTLVITTNTSQLFTQGESNLASASLEDKQSDGNTHLSSKRLIIHTNV